MAEAGTTWYSANGTIVPAGVHVTGAQVKSGSGVAGQFNPTYIQYGRTLGAIMALDASGYPNAPGASARYDIQPGDTVNLPNAVVAGTAVRMKWWGNPFWPDNTTVTARWRSN